MLFTLSEALSVLRPVLYFVLGMAVYAFFVFKFYCFLAKRDIFEFDERDYGKGDHPFLDKTLGVGLYILQYLVLFPLIVFFWFGVLTVFLVFMSKNQPIDTILVSSIAVVGAVRVTAFYAEELSKELAKVLPIALLALLLVDISYFSFSHALSLLVQAVQKWNILIYYLIFVVVLEFVLRMGYLLLGRKEIIEEKKKQKAGR